MTPSREAIEAALDAYFSEDGVLWRSFSTASQMKEDMEAALTAAYACDFPQPSKSDEERAREISDASVRAWIGEVLLDRREECRKSIIDLSAAIRAEATLAEQERCADMAEHLGDNEVAAAIRKEE